MTSISGHHGDFESSMTGRSQKASKWFRSGDNLYPKKTSENVLIGTKTNTDSHKLLCTGTAKITDTLTCSGDYNLFKDLTTERGLNICNTDTSIAYGGYADFYERDATLTNGKADYRIRIHAPHDLGVNKDLQLPVEAGVVAILGLNTGAMTFADTDAIGWGWNGAVANYTMSYNTNLLWYAKSGQSFSLIMASDNAEDNSDSWLINITETGTYSLSNKISGSFLDYISIVPHATTTSGVMTIGCGLVVSGSFSFTGDLDLTGDLSIADDKYIKFGASGDYTIRYDETTTDKLQIGNGVANTDLNISFMTDLGADAGDIWNLKINHDAPDLIFQSTIRSTSHYTSMFQLHPTYDSTRDAGRPEFYIGSPALGLLTSGLPPIYEGSAWPGWTAISVATGTNTNETDRMLLASNLYLTQATGTPYLRYIQSADADLNQSGAGIFIAGNWISFYTSPAGAVTKDATMSTLERLKIDNDGTIEFNGLPVIKNDMEVDDDYYIKFGTHNDYALGYDGTHLVAKTLIDGTDFNFNWWSDRGDTNLSKYSWYIPANGQYCSLNNFASGSWASPFAMYPNSSGDTTLDNVWIKNLVVSTSASADPWEAIGLMSVMSTPTYATILNRLLYQGYWSNRGILNECDDSGNTYRATIENRTTNDEASEIFLSTNGMPRWDISARESTGSYELRFYSNETSSGTGSWRPTFAGASTLAFGISVDGICTADRYFVPFTGSHDCKINDTIDYEKGLIIDVIDSDVRVNHHYPNGDVCNNDFTCKLCDTPNSKSVLGVINQKTKPKSKTPEKKDDNLPAGTFMFNWSVNAVGEGSILITDINGEINKGDLIVSSEIAGYGMCQKTAKGLDDIIRSKTIAKCMKVINWSNITDTIIHNGFTYKKLLCPCIYMCG